MKTFEMLLEMPAVPAIMAVLIEHPEGIGESEITIPEGTPGRLEDALSALSRYGIIERQSGRVRVAPGDGPRDAASRIVAVFREIRSLTETAFMIRGILVATEYFECLVHRDTMLAMLTEENVTKEMAERIVAAEEKQGYIENFDIAYHVRGGLQEKFFPFIPRHHYEDFVFMHSRTGQSSPAGPGARVVNERYLLTHHPASLAEQARQYMTRHKPHLLNRVRNEAFDIIWWFDRY